MTAAESEVQIALMSLRCVLNTTASRTSHRQLPSPSVFRLTLEGYATANTGASMVHSPMSYHTHGPAYSADSFDTALVIWHHLLTFDKEVRFFWRRKLTGPCALFLVTRYSTLAWYIYYTCWLFVDIASSTVSRLPYPNFVLTTTYCAFVQRGACPVVHFR